MFPSSELQVRRELRRRPAVPPPVRRLQRIPERNHAEREEPAELRAVPPQVKGRACGRGRGQGAEPQAGFHLFSFSFSRDEGLSSSQAHIALNDHASLFHETKEQLDGSTTPSELSGTPRHPRDASVSSALQSRTRTATCPWRTTRAAPTPPRTRPTARTRKARSPPRNAGRTWRLIQPSAHTGKVGAPPR